MGDDSNCLVVRSPADRISDDNGVMGWEREEAAYREWGPDMMRLAAALVGPSDAEDLVSITLTSLLISGRWAASHDMRAYALGSVVRQAASMHRSSARRRVREQRSATTHSTVDADGGDPQLQRLLLTLPMRQRAVLYLTYWVDLTPAVIGQTLGISEGSVRRHLARARATLRRSLA